MANQDFTFGSSTIEGFFNFMRERHKIWINRFIYKKPKPWTEDKILQQYKFTNVFRQLDKGTIVLNDMLKKIRYGDGQDYDKEVLWNVAWYRLFNLAVHAEQGPFYTFESLDGYIRNRAVRGEQIFTGAHLLRGMEGEAKHDTYLRSSKEFWDETDVILEACKTNSMETVYETLLQFEMVGGFIAYEMVCDLRFTHLLENATDINAWANIGPGADRGMRRLGLPSDLWTMRALYHIAVNDMEDSKLEESPYWNQDSFGPIWDAISNGLNLTGIFSGANYEDEGFNQFVFYECNKLFFKYRVQFELREIEHSLCEFDKYERVRCGQGRPRSRYPGV